MQTKLGLPLAEDDSWQQMGGSMQLCTHLPSMFIHKWLNQKHPHHYISFDLY
jgi:hypothetical protein